MEVGKEVTRRDALKLAAGAAALGAALGIPRSALALAARGEPAQAFLMKLWFQGKLLQTVQMTEEQSRLIGANPGALTVKIHGGPTQLGAMSLTPDIQLKLRAFYKPAR